ncbi:MAG: dockerin type I domain-containing protein [Phycisphaerae bacterium]
MMSSKSVQSMRMQTIAVCEIVDRLHGRKRLGMIAAGLTYMIASAFPFRAAGQACIPPVNETCDQSIVFTASDLPLITTGVYGCVNDIPNRPYWDVFYRFDCTCTGAYTIDMCDSTADAFLRIYVDDCGFLNGTELLTADDECPGSPPNADPEVTAILEAGMSYWFELGTWRPDPPFGPPGPNAPFNFNVSACTPCGNGDVNQDGLVNGADIQPFVAELLNPGTLTPSACAADMNRSGTVGPEDLSRFVAILFVQ